MIYDAAILPLTSKWYREVLERLPRQARVLDVGIGTGGALVKNAELVRQKGLDIVGIDIDGDYVKKCAKRIRKADLSDHVRVYLQPVQNHEGGPYDAIYFSASFMLLPQPRDILVDVQRLLQPNGRIYFTQTFQDKRSILTERAKPLLKAVTSIDFGQVTYEADFMAVVDGAGVEITELKTMGRNGTRSFRLAVGVPAPA
jgi:ubiquinone/menaquinone biosynthesis C-methylase UbiE